MTVQKRSAVATAVQKRTAVSALALVGAVLVSGMVSGVGTVAMAQEGPDGKGPAAHMTELFGKVDANADGKVTQEELTTHRTAMFTAADTNGDGKLSSDELAARELARFNETMPDRVARMLSREDANADGSISADEIPEGPMLDNFARIDADDDGAISQAEVAEATKHRGKRKHGMKGGWFN